MGRPSRFDLVGGAIAIDLVNTVSWRGDPARTTERVPDFAALLAWARRAGAIDAGAAEQLAAASTGSATAAQRTTMAVHDLREALHAVLSAAISDGEPDPEALRAVHAHIAEAVASAEPGDGLPLRWQPRFDRPQALHDVLALEVLGLLRDGDPRRVGRCADEACGWFFLDHSRNRSRRWCSSPDCGNRDRVSRHRRQIAGG